MILNTEEFTQTFDVDSIFWLRKANFTFVYVEDNETSRNMTIVIFQSKTNE